MSTLPEVLQAELQRWRITPDCYDWLVLDMESKIVCRGNYAECTAFVAAELVAAIASAGLKVVRAAAATPEHCDHTWVDARNKAVTSGELCLKCGAVRAGNTATVALEVRQISVWLRTGMWPRSGDLEA